MMPPLDLSHCEHLEYLRVMTLFSTFIPLLPPSLKHLNLQKNIQMWELTVPEAEDIDLPLLESIDCTLSAQLAVSSIRRLIAQSNKAGRLRKLGLSPAVWDRMHLLPPTIVETTTGDPLDNVFLTSTSVTELSIVSITSGSIDEDRVIAIVALFPNLRFLDASYNRHITGVAVKAFVRGGIKHLKLTDCYDISPDAIEWARGRA